MQCAPLHVRACVFLCVVYHLDGVDASVEELARGVVQDFRHGRLDDGVGTEDALRQRDQPVRHLVEKTKTSHGGATR